MSVKTLSLKAPAKLNLWLEITGRRPDGYHELDTLMCPVSLCDELELTLAPGRGVALTVSDTLGQNIPADSDNLAFRAVLLFFTRLKLAPGVNIKLVKKIPAGAGLGGGSSNAAAVLHGLNVLHNSPLSAAELAQMALTLGADVPFFLLGGPARALGIGEKLEPTACNFKLAAIIIFPGVAAPTAKIYQNFKLALTNTPKHSICLKVKNDITLPGLGFNLRNDLAQSARELFPAIAEAENALKFLGLTHVCMSGSGSAVFGLCHDMEEAQRLVSGLKIKANWCVFTVEILNKFGIVL